ncbi:hypothetical protein [Polaromonas sp. AET17H-212]|uniref:hypothetical protein n=1 Tax=Polaromonas sp. AET17H-212 TaxID=1977061 RepID=UPI001142D447|nr:hypothetical protein [Polaromonas sp. AET17H-212]
MREKFRAVALVFAVALGAMLAMTGCAGARLTSKPEAVGQLKLTSAKVQWETFHDVKLRYPKAFGAEYARKEVAPVLDAFLKKGPGKIEKLLAESGVPKGNDFTLELTPKTFTYNSAGAKHFEIAVVIRAASGHTRGWISVATNGSDYADPDAFVDSFAKILVSEMKTAGWY